MKQIQTPETRTYRDGEFIVEITFDGKVFDAWLSAEQYGIKTFMFGLAVLQLDGTVYDWDLAEEVVEANLEEYEEDYRADYMD